MFYAPSFPKVLSAATIVAKHTSALCNACRLASSKTSNPVAKRQFVQSAKEVANSTANLVKSIKVSLSLFLISCVGIIMGNVTMCLCCNVRLLMGPLTRRTDWSVRKPLGRSSRLWITWLPSLQTQSLLAYLHRSAQRYHVISLNILPFNSLGCF